MSQFIDCNSRYRYDDSGSFCEEDIKVSKEVVIKQLNESIDSGLIVDCEAGIFIKEGYGALIGFCPDNCSTIDDVLNYTIPDWERKTAGKPTIKEKIREIKDGENLPFDPYFGYKKLVDNGYDLVIGPGGMVYGERWNKAVYCKNYQTILNRENNKAQVKEYIK